MEMIMLITSAVLVVSSIPIILSYLILLYVLSSDSYLVHLMISRLEEKLANKEYSNIFKVLLRFSILVLEINHKILSFLSFLFAQQPPHTKSPSPDHSHQQRSHSQQSDEDLVFACINAQPLGFSNGRPIAACIIYKCLTQWQSFQDQNTTIFDRIILTIDQQIQTRQDDNNVLAYWLSNACTLLVPVLQLQLEPKYPALLNFKQELTECVEKTYRILRDNLWKQVYMLLVPYLKASITSKSDSPWQKIVNSIEWFLDLLNCNHVPPFLVRKIFTQIFSYLNVQLFNSIMLKRELCSMSHGEDVEAGLSQLKQWCSKATEEYVGSAWDELKHTRQAIGFMVSHEKSRKSLAVITQDMCPLLNMQQLYRICNLFFDDKYRTHSVIPEVRSKLKDLAADYSNNDVYLLDHDSSIPFSVDDLSRSMDQVDIIDIELPSLVLDHWGLDFLLSRVES